MKMGIVHHTETAMRIIGILILFVTCLALATPAAAQTKIQNPTLIAFTPSPDHALISNYRAEILSSAGAVMATIDLGKPAICLVASGACLGIPVGDIPAAIQVQPIAFGSYTIVVRAMAGTIAGVPSPPTEVFDRAPGAPSKGTLK